MLSNQMRGTPARSRRRGRRTRVGRSPARSSAWAGVDLVHTADGNVTNPCAISRAGIFPIVAISGEEPMILMPNGLAVLTLVAANALGVAVAPTAAWINKPSAATPTFTTIPAGAGS